MFCDNDPCIHIQISKNLLRILQSTTKNGNLTQLVIFILTI